MTHAPHPTIPSTDTQAAVPEGFRPVRLGGPFIAHNGPLSARLLDGRVQLGFRVEARHTNPLGICHGGMLATFADMLIPCAAMYHPGLEPRFLPTISLQMDYMGAARLGCWVQGEAQVLRSTRNMVFGQALISCDGEPAVRVSGVFKLGQAMGEPGQPFDPLGVLAVQA
ncbi:PaaI family thioesterase [Hydrogenophaga palleronii]|uniref:PaaI family thioesterase n=1 Tax=Hydrogenophaga palleronii TaxID=65655 RepID=UPI000826F950|nr:PaaI family thioesterase [Hydrogenophaga palleronii]